MRKVHVLLTKEEISTEKLATDKKIAVVLDILLATTTIVAALKHGAAKVIPVLNPDEAMRVSSLYQSGQALVAGELQAKPIEGFLYPSPTQISSLSGHKAAAHLPHYSSSKAAVINFTRALALELAPYGIRANSVSPGYIDTPLTEWSLTNERFLKSIERNTALNRVGTSEEVSNVIAFLASHEASYMTGSDVLVDGGWMIT